MTVITMKARFSGLYTWGVGWNDDSIAKSWDDYFKNLEVLVDPSFWTFLDAGEQHLHAKYLVCTDGCVYLHPMEIIYVGHSSVTSYTIDENGRKIPTHPVVDELKKILAGAANACGGTVEFSEISTHEIPDPVM